MHVFPYRRPTPGALVLATAVAFVADASAQDHGSLADAVAAMDSQRLRAAYLQCSDLSERFLLDVHVAAVCSTISETVLKREFDGDFARQLTWWRGERARRQGRPAK